VASPRLPFARSRQRALQRELDHVRAELAVQSRLADELVAQVSHELRTPLTSIIGYVETMLDGEVGEFTEEQEHFLRVVDRNAERLLGMVGDLLFVGEIDAGKLELDPRRLDLGRLVGECVEAAQPTAVERRVELTLDEAAVPPVAADRQRLGQVLDNLVSNALKFTPPGGRVAVRLRPEKGAVAIEVEDSGVGIPQADQARLFDRFFRAAGAKAIPGNGLGLSVAQAIVEAHGGRIGVTSVEGAGSTFRVELPA
jgi:signal transduction histidine kinase